MNVMEFRSPVGASTTGDAGHAARGGVRRAGGDSDDEDDVRKGGRRFKQAGTPNLHLLHSFPCLADWQRRDAGIPSLLALRRLIRLERAGFEQIGANMQSGTGRTIMRSWAG
jgi:hypothetical protein